jgi:hypothetical protein
VSVDSASFAGERARSLVNNPWLDGVLHRPRRNIGAVGGVTPVDREVAASPSTVAASARTDCAHVDETPNGGNQSGAAQVQAG